MLRARINSKPTIELPRLGLLGLPSQSICYMKQDLEKYFTKIYRLELCTLRPNKLENTAKMVNAINLWVT